MHRDTQIGLAMSIVLIGFAAALCFPRESPHRVASLQLPGARSLDAAIEQLPVRAYTAAVEVPTSAAPDNTGAAASAADNVVARSDLGRDDGSTL